MNIRQIAAATVVPAVVAGVAFTTVPFAQAAPVTPAAHAAVQHVTQAAPQHKRAHHHQAKAATASSTTAHAARHGTSQATAAQRGTTAASTSGQAASQQSASVTSNTFNPSAVPAYERCVAWRESGDTPTDPDGLFGILPYIWQSLGYSGTAGQAPVAQQQQAFDRLYAQYGTQPWSPSDGC